MTPAAPTLDSRIAAFAAAVRAHLDDLDPEDVDDLTGGLEADLQEEAADHDGTLDLGDPVRYADELRASAGLPERAAAAPALSVAAHLRARIEERRRIMLEGIRGNRELSAILDLLIVFRPVWWLLRAWAGYRIIAAVFGYSGVLPTNIVAWVLLIGLTVVSVQWGLGRWARSSPARAFRTFSSVVTALALVILIPVSTDGLAADRYVADSSSYQPPGLALEGKQITNMFVYDADGNPLSRVQVFDQDGEPLTTTSSTPGSATGSVYDSSTGVEHAPADAWNVFPLDRADAAVAAGTGEAASGETRLPFAKASPLAPASDATPTPTPTPGTSADPGSTPAPDATPTEAPAPTPTPAP